MPSTRCDRELVLGLADDALIASHRLSEWVARAPELEEDIALANIALDLLGQARLLLTYAGELGAGELGAGETGSGETEDDLAYLRPAAEFRNATMLERPNGDFAGTIVRLLLLAAYQYELYRRLAEGDDDRLAAIAEKAVKEVSYHRDHGRLWTLRLGDGTPESHRRMRAAVDEEWPWFCSLVDGIEGEPEIRRWAAAVLAEATLDVPADVVAEPRGRDGEHTPHLGAILAEMREVTAAHPGARW